MLVPIHFSSSSPTIRSADDAVKCVWLRTGDALQSECPELTGFLGITIGSGQGSNRREVRV